MKKSTLLSLLTAGAVIATSAGTFAAWDKLSDVSTGKLSFDKPVTVTAEKMSFTQSSRALKENPVATANATFNISNVPTDKIDGIKLTATVLSGETNVTDQVNITIKKNNVPVNASGLDDSVAAGENTYSVEVTPKADTEVVSDSNLLNELTVNVTGELQTK